VPLRALVDGDAVIAPFLPDADWEALRRGVAAGATRAVLPCCGATARRRRSRLGTKHFYHHAQGDCAWAPESVQHLRAKAELALAARAAGFTAVPAAAGPDWRADVLVTGAGRPIAFEGQWSAQTLEETEARQPRSARAGVRGGWFFRRPPSEPGPWSGARRDLLVAEERDRHARTTTGRPPGPPRHPPAPAGAPGHPAPRPAPLISVPIFLRPGLVPVGVGERLAGEPGGGDAAERWGMPRGRRPGSAARV
jgi:hypothetical protein